MVIPLRPTKFYGSSLPRPRFYTDVKFSDERIDPPVSVLDPLMSWATEAHWSMGGLCLNRLRLQGKIEGNVKKLRKQIDVKIRNATPKSMKGGCWKGEDWVDSPPPALISKKRRQRAKAVDEEDEEEEEEEIEFEIERRKESRKNGGMMKKKKRRRLVRKLGDDFELVLSEDRKTGSIPLKEGGVALRTRSRRSMVLMEEEDDDNSVVNKSRVNKVDVENRKGNKTKGKGSASPNGLRISPRLKKTLN